MMSIFGEKNRLAGGGAKDSKSPSELCPIWEDETTFFFLGGVVGKKTWVKNLTAQQVDNMMSRPFFGGGKKNLEDIIPTARYELLDVWRSSAKAMLLGDRIRLGRPPPPRF